MNYCIGCIDWCIFASLINLKTLPIMTTQQRIKMMADIARHGNQLNAIFHTGLNPVELCKKLRKLENRATKLTEDECNTGNDHTAAIESIRSQVVTLLNASEIIRSAIFINRDPRGYALKIENSYMREHNINLYQDWGSYGILAPDFTPHN